MKDVVKVENPNGELYKSIKNAMSNNYRRLHHRPLLRGEVKRSIRSYEIKTLNLIE